MSPPRRIFFAIRPAPPARLALHEMATRWARAAGGRAISPSRVHLTLLFLGAVPDTRVSALREAAGRVRAEPFTLTLDTAGVFKQVGVGWAGVRASPAAFVSLQAMLAREVRQAGFAIDDRAFVPHVTLVRNVARAQTEAPEVGPLAWPVRRFSLLASEAGRAGYQWLGGWRLDGAAREGRGGA